jgi:DNA-nicking Smr family endonuclease
MKKKKSKPSEQAPSADFKNNPFRSLKGVVTGREQVPSKNKPAAKREEKPASAEDDAALFLRAMEGARKIERVDATIAAPRKQATTIPPGVGSREDEDLFLRAMQKIGTTFHEFEPEPEETEHRSQTNRMRQLKRGTLRISQELDLHGYLKDEALTRLEHFVANAYDLGQSAVLVITGKGINSPEGPVLQGAVAAWLRGKGKGMVAEFGAAPRDKGGSGAFVVFLKKK